MKNKRILILLCITVIVAAFASCKSVSVDNKPLAGTILPVTEYNDALGCGYDIVTGEYYRPQSVNCVNAIFDMNALANDNLIKEAASTATKDIVHIAGTTVMEYEKSLSADASISVDHCYYKADFKMSFTKDSSVKSTASFVKSVDTIVKKYQFVSSDSSLDLCTTLEPYETKAFKDAINSETVDPYDIFRNYGTHVLLKIAVGGRMELNYMVDNTENMSQSDLKVCAKEAYLYVSGEQSVELSEKTRKFTHSENFTLRQIGGSSNNSISEYDQSAAAYSTWYSDIEKGDQLDFIGAGDPSKTNELLPIWKLAKDSSRQKQIEDAYLEYLKINGDSYFNGLQPAKKDTYTTEYIHNIYFGDSDKKDEGKAAMSNLITNIKNAEPDSKYVIIDKDLNNKAGGDFIYMGYTLTTNSAEAITDLKLDFRKNKNKSEMSNNPTYNGALYTKINLDLTKGTGGDFYIVLYTTKDAKAGKPLLLANLEYGEGGYLFDINQRGWTSVGTFDGSYSKLDLNKGAGGNDIFLWKLQ